MKRLDTYACEKQGELVFSNKLELVEFLLANRNKSFRVSIVRETGVRTEKQSDSLHLWFDWVANTFNEHGLSVQYVLSQAMDIDWTPEMVKEFWKNTQKKMTGKTSTKQLDKVEDINLIWEHFNRHFGQKFGLHIPFPNKSLQTK